METKLFELRDHGTFIPLLCIKPQFPTPHRSPCVWADPHREVGMPAKCTCGASFEEKMAWRYGYRGSRAVIVTHMSEPGRGCKVDPHEWGDRTFQTAHCYIEEHWDELHSGDLIDVRVIIGETDQPCASEA